MRALLVLLLFAASACDDRDTDPAPSPAPNFSRDPETGETRARIAAGSQTAELRSGASVPVALPLGFTLYPGAEIIRNTQVDSVGKRHTLVEFATPDPVAKVMLFYRAQAQAAGAWVSVDLDGSEAASIGGQIPAGQFALTARANGNGTIAQLSFDQSVGSTRP